MVQLNVSDVFVALLAVIGPPKILLSFADLAGPRTTREIWRLAAVSTAAAAVVGVLVDLSAPALLSLFHIGVESLELAGGAIFFVYAVGLVLANPMAGAPQRQGSGLVDGLRELVVPFIASPLAVTAVLIYAVDRSGWGWRSAIAGTYLSVLAIDVAFLIAFAGLLRRMHRTVVAVVARLLGLLLAAVSVEVVLDALTSLGVHLNSR